MFLRILHNLRLLAHQGLPLRGSEGDTDSNFFQFAAPPASWFHWDNIMGRQKNQQIYISWYPKRVFTTYGITYSSSGECRYSRLPMLQYHGWWMHRYSQLTIYLRWVDEELGDHEDFIGLYQVDSIDASSLVQAIKDTLIWLNLPISNCRGQCYDGASNMSGFKNGVAAQIIANEKRAVFIHCHAHALSLAVEDCIKNSKVCREALETTFEISKLIKFSPKRNATFDRIKAEIVNDSSVGGIRKFCPTRWTLRGRSNQKHTGELWCLKSALGRVSRREIGTWC